MNTIGTRGRMRVAITGSSGLIGTALRARLTADGHDVLAMVRGPRDAPASVWNPAERWIRDGALDGVDAVVHLAGASIAGESILRSRWNNRRKRVLWESRVDSAALLIEHMRGLGNRPRTFVSASAVGYYGSRGDETLTEQSQRGSGYLSDLCDAWEQAARGAEDLGMRSVQLRTAGIVLASGHGALARMAPIFRLGLGGRLGDGAQWTSWIGLDDEVGAIVHLLGADATSGAVNVVAPEAATNREFTRALASALRRPAVAPVPAFALRLLLGELAGETVLASQRAVPERLQSSGYEFAQPTLETGLAAALSR